ncbi:MAG TPA: DinB family protein [Tepidisphaeraceae bacterium]|jgi:hypothetical protein
MTRQQVLADCIRETRPLLARYLKGFDDTNHTKQAPGLPNHLAWTLGHLALTMQRTAERLDGIAPPESDFIKGDGKSGTPDRFDTESICFGSKPIDDPRLYPKFTRCVAIFNVAVDRIADATLKASDKTLDAKSKWGRIEVQNWTLIPRMVFHNGNHNGQIADLRRALGMGSIFT